MRRRTAPSRSSSRNCWISIFSATEGMARLKSEKRTLLMRRCTKMRSFRWPSTILRASSVSPNSRSAGGAWLCWRGAYVFVRSCHFRGLALSVPEVVGPRYLRVLRQVLDPGLEHEGLDGRATRGDPPDRSFEASGARLSGDAQCAAFITSPP